MRNRATTAFPSPSTMLGPLPSRVALLHEDGGVLVGGCAYCTNPRTLWSTPDPLPVDPDPRAVRVVSGLIVGLRL